MRRFSAVVIRSFLLWLTLCSLALAAEEGLLWRVSGQGAEGYLFGTMHSEDPRVTRLPQEVEKQFAAADTLMLEVALDAETESFMARQMLLPPESSLTTEVGEALAREARQAMLGRGVPPEVTERLQPWATVLILSTPVQESGLFLDKLLYERAQASGKVFYPLESAAEQIAIFAELKGSEQRELLRSVLGEYQSYPALFVQMTEAYLDRDLSRLVAMSEENPLSSDTALQQKVMGRLLDERNRRMVERMVPRLQEGVVFVAVGALHLPGEMGLIALLRQRGYQVEARY